MKKLFNENKLYVFGAVVGAIGGFMYWKFVGCSSGTCMITSSPRNSTLYFALMGAIFMGMFKKEKQRAE
ncbi:MAG TPA: DUF6132 family protein [Chitinophagaceae bacterium]|nr:DUF6132 family protein [Chitinophagaceae bacterium]